METIPDIRRERGNPDAGEPTAGPFLIQRSFRNTGAGLRVAAAVLMIGGALTIGIGVCTLVFPIAVVGMMGLLGAIVLFWQAPNIVDLTKVK